MEEAPKGRYFDFGDFYAETRWQFFDGENLFYSYDIVNNQDIDAITVSVDGEQVDTTYDVSNGYDPDTKRIVLTAIIHFDKEKHRDSCDLIIGAKGSDKTYKDIVVLNDNSGK